MLLLPHDDYIDNPTDHYNEDNNEIMMIPVKYCK